MHNALQGQRRKAMLSFMSMGDMSEDYSMVYTCRPLAVADLPLRAESFENFVTAPVYK